jgi:putative heme-binding domain-containing protein
VNLSDPTVIQAGQALFAQNCSVGYCHGVAGRSGRGPRLRGREWDKNYLYKVTLEGIPNSSMPAWKNRLSETEIASIVAYVLSLSRLTSDSEDVSNTSQAQPIPSSVPSVPARSAAPSGNIKAGLLGDPEKGKALFFDSANDLNCGTCHKIAGAGSEVGPDLSKAARKPSRELFTDIVLPEATLSSDKRLLRITTKTGEQIQAIQIEESASHLKVYDIQSLPPVLRTLPKEQIQERTFLARSAMPGRYAELYTVKQLLDIIAFIKLSSGDSAPVSLADLQ